MGNMGQLTDLDYAHDMFANPLNTNYAKNAREIRKRIRKSGLKINVKKTKEMRIALTKPRAPLYAQ